MSKDINLHINESSKAQMDDIVSRNTKPRNISKKQMDESRWMLEYVPVWNGKSLMLDYIYSLGQVVFSLIVSGNSGAYEEFTHNMHALNHQEIDERYDLGINPALLKLLYRSTSYYPNKRPQSVGEFVDELKEVRQKITQE